MMYLDGAAEDGRRGASFIRVNDDGKADILYIYIYIYIRYMYICI